MLLDQSRTEPATVLSCTSWLRALTLAERHAILADRERTPSFDWQLGEHLLSQWRAQTPFGDETVLAQRLAADALSLEQFRRALGTPISALATGQDAPQWMRHVHDALSARAGRAAGRALPGVSADSPEAALLAPLHRLIRPAWRRLTRDLASLPRNLAGPRGDAAGLAAAWFTNLYADLYGMVGRTLVLELHVMGMRGLLAGKDPEQRFRSFCRRLARRDALRDLLLEYPVLARALSERIEQWVDFGAEFFARLQRDLPLVRATLELESPLGPIADLDARASDSHCKGRRVVIVTFESGVRLVYKPRTLAMDVHFAQLVEWFNERGDHPALRVPRAIDRGPYGWHEFIAQAPCESEAQLSRFYQRHGALIALMYVLQATDFHAENLIAAGEHPILVDMESLLLPRFDAFGKSKGVDARLGEAFGYSVLRAGLLPQGLSFDGAEEGLDISALGSVAGRLTPYRVPFFDQAGTDRMRLARERLALQPNKNRPTLAGEPVDPLRYIEALNSGFRCAYCTLLRCRDEMLSTDGPLSRFARDEVRPILRVSQNYAFLLEESFHPDLLRDALDRDRFFDRLWIQSHHGQRTPEIVKAERDDLLAGDLPRFTGRADSSDIWTSAGRRIAGFFSESGLQAARRCLQQLGERDFDWQYWLMNAALATTAKGSVTARVPPTSFAMAAARPGATLLDTASRIGQRLAQLAQRKDGEASWLGLVLVGPQQTGIRPLQNDLYDGLPGVCLFLAYLGELTGQGEHTELAEEALSAMLRYRGRHGRLLGSVGGFDGWGGMIYALTHLGALWKRSDLILEAQELARRLPPLVQRAAVDGVLGGTAGALASLLALHEVSGSRDVLETARLCGERLIERAEISEAGAGWKIEPGAPALCGFAHGAAGIAFALSKLAAATGELRYRRIAELAIDYERSLYSPALGNWPDLRPDPPAPERGAMLAWCHGAPGIGLGRVASALPLDARARQEIETAIEVSLSEGFGDNHSLCHGDLGNLELILQAGELLGDARLRSKGGEIAAAILQDIAANGWRCGVALQVEHPGLMTGLAGIGYGLLRLSNPSAIPSVLTLESPRTPARWDGVAARAADAARA